MPMSYDPKSVLYHSRRNDAERELGRVFDGALERAAEKWRLSQPDLPPDPPMAWLKYWVPYFMAEHMTVDLARAAISFVRTRRKLGWEKPAMSEHEPRGSGANGPEITRFDLGETDFAEVSVCANESRLDIGTVFLQADRTLRSWSAERGFELTDENRDALLVAIRGELAEELRGRKIRWRLVLERVAEDIA